MSLYNRLPFEQSLHLLVALSSRNVRTYLAGTTSRPRLSTRSLSASKDKELHAGGQVSYLQDMKDRQALQGVYVSSSSTLKHRPVSYNTLVDQYYQFSSLVLFELLFLIVH
jgi:hypothetical protein